jgi:hypothetical protein
VIFLLAIAAWQSVFGDGMSVNIDGDESTARWVRCWV